MEINFKTVKKMLLDEYEQMYVDVHNIVIKNIMSDAGREMSYIGYNIGKSTISNASNWKELEAALSFCGYRMSLQEWLDSY